MESVEVVIRIPKEEYEKYKREEETIRTYQRQGLDSVSKYMVAILDGTVLPKGHGTLKDTDAICKDIISALGIRDENYLLEAEKAIYKRIKNANAIIEADKGE